MPKAVELLPSPECGNIGYALVGVDYLLIHMGHCPVCGHCYAIGLKDGISREKEESCICGELLHFPEMKG